MSAHLPINALRIQINPFHIRRQTISTDEVYGKIMGGLSFMVSSSSDRERDLWLEEAAFRCSNLSRLLVHLTDYSQRHGKNFVRGIGFLRTKQALMGFLSFKPQLAGPGVDCRRHLIDMCSSLNEWFKPITGMTLELETAEPILLTPRGTQALVLICVNMILNAASASLGHSQRRVVGIALSRGSDAVVTLTLTDNGLEAASFSANPIFGVIGNLLSLLDCETCVRATQCGGLRLTIDLHASGSDPRHSTEFHPGTFKEVLVC